MSKVYFGFNHHPLLAPVFFMSPNHQQYCHDHQSLLSLTLFWFLFLVVNFWNLFISLLVTFLIQKNVNDKSNSEVLHGVFCPGSVLVLPVHPDAVKDDGEADVEDEVDSANS